MFETDSGHLPDDRFCELRCPIGRKYLHSCSPNIPLAKVIPNIKERGVWVNIEIQIEIQKETFSLQKEIPPTQLTLAGFAPLMRGCRK
jgi:hypothetical protein